MAGWHGLGYKTGEVGLWRVEDGALARIPVGRAPVQGDGQPITGVDLISNDSFQNFELAWEWQVASAGNSGLKYNVSESLSTEMAPPHAAKGWEYQMLDDSLAEDNKIPSHRAGALYDMFPPSTATAVKPAGKWNSSRLVFAGNHGEHWLNGVKVVEFELGSRRSTRRLRRASTRNIRRGFRCDAKGKSFFRTTTQASGFAASRSGRSNEQR